MSASPRAQQIAQKFAKTKQPNFCTNCGGALSPLNMYANCPKCDAPIKRIRVSTLRQVKTSTHSVDSKLIDVMRKRQERTEQHTVINTPRASEEQIASNLSSSTGSAENYVKIKIPTSYTSPIISRRRNSDSKNDDKKKPEAVPEPKKETPQASPEPDKSQQELFFEVVEDRDENTDTTDVVIDVIEEVEISQEEVKALSESSAMNKNSSEIQMGTASKRGKRKHNEDAHISESPLQGAPQEMHLFGVFDGHAGKKASHFCQKRFSKLLLKNKKLPNDKAKALYETFLKVDEKYLEELEDDGCTACVGLITSDLKLFVANAGDSRCVISKSGQVKQMSTDHKPDLKEEKKRIENAGHEVEMETIVMLGKRVQVARIDGIQACSRGIGDSEFKDFDGPPEEQAVTSAPEITQEQLSKGDFIVCACDGLWDVMSNEDVIKYVKQYLGSYDLDQIAAALCLHAIEIGSDDNVSCVIVVV